MICLLTDEHDFNSIIAADFKIIFVDFYADWCEPCKWLDQILMEIEPAFGNDVLILKVDVEKYQNLQQLYVIRGVPVLVLFKNGKEVSRLSGFLTGPELVQWVKSFF